MRNPDARRTEHADGETLRLAELGLLEADELAAPAERAHEASLRVGTPRDQISGGDRETGVSMDAAVVTLSDAVRERTDPRPPRR